MHKLLLLTAATVLGLSTAGTLASQRPARLLTAFDPFAASKGAAILYNQNSNSSGGWISSQNYTPPYTSFGDQSADDFVVPRGKSWTITKVDVTGMWFNGSGPAQSENVIFYRDRHGTPGRTVEAFIGLTGKDREGSLGIRLPGRGLRLKPGSYWVSVIVNCGFTVCGQWGWDVNAVQHGNQAMYRQPAFPPCQNWQPIENCGANGPDLMFDLRGTAR